MQRARWKPRVDGAIVPPEGVRRSMSRHVVLDQAEDAFVEGLVATGRFDTVDHAVREALRLLQEREARLAALQDAWAEGCESGGWQSAETVFEELAGRYGSDAKAAG